MTTYNLKTVTVMHKDRFAQRLPKVGRYASSARLPESDGSPTQVDSNELIHPTGDMWKERTSPLLIANRQLLEANKQLVKRLEKYRRDETSPKADARDSVPFSEELGRLVRFAEKRGRHAGKLIVIIIALLLINLFFLGMIFYRLEHIPVGQTTEESNQPGKEVALEAEIATLKEEISHLQKNDAENSALIRAVQKEPGKERPTPSQFVPELQEQIKERKPAKRLEAVHWEKVY